MRVGGAGFLLETESVRHPLGEHGGRTLTARVEHRVVRVALGGRRSFRLSVGRWRPSAIEVQDIDGLSPPEEVTVTAPRDPWMQTVTRVLLLWSAAALARSAVQRARGRNEGGNHR